jgi:small subunit ribosomal protein S20
MANTKSAEKRHRQNVEHRTRNRSQRSQMRSAIKELRATVEQGEAKEARALLPRTLKIVDMSASKGVIHANTAARYKSRLSKAVAALPG